MWNHGSVSRSYAGNGILSGSHGAVRDWNGGNQNCVDLRIFPLSQILAFFVYLLSGFLDCDNCASGGLLLVCEKEMPESIKSGHIEPYSKKYQKRMRTFVFLD